MKKSLTFDTPSFRRKPESNLEVISQKCCNSALIGRYPILELRKDLVFEHVLYLIQEALEFKRTIFTRRPTQTIGR